MTIKVSNYDKHKDLFTTQTKFVSIVDTARVAVVVVVVAVVIVVVANFPPSCLSCCKGSAPRVFEAELKIQDVTLFWLTYLWEIQFLAYQIQGGPKFLPFYRVFLNF